MRAHPPPAMTEPTLPRGYLCSGVLASRTARRAGLLRNAGLLLATAMLTVSLAPAGASAEPANTAPEAPAGLVADDVERPLNTSLNPRFGWLPQDADPNEIQTAYQITVYGADADAVWDTGKVASSQQSYVKYDGPDLRSGTAYTWRVRTWDRHDEVSPWSQAATFETGLGDADWSDAEWIKRVPGNPDNGALRIVDGRARVSGGDVTLAKTGTSWTDYTAEMTVTPKTKGAGIVFRAPNTANGYMWQLIPGTGFRPHVLANGSYTKLPDVPMTITVDTSYQVKVEVAGTRIRTWINGDLADERTDATHAAGTIGFRESSGEVAEFEDVKVTAPDGTVLFSDDFSAGTAQWSATGTQEADEWTLARTEVDLPAGEIVRARAYVAGSHTYELWLNGQRADRGDSFGYAGEGYYQASDVTRLVEAGNRLAIGAVLHWYGGGQGRAANVPGLLVKLVVEYADGSSKVVVSDASWRAKRGPYVSTSRRGEADFIEHLDGVADAANGAWKQPGYDASAWSPAISLGEHPTSQFTHLNGLETRISETVVHPVRILTAQDGTPVADFGKVIPARPGVRFDSGVAGRVLTLRASYLLASNGRVSTSGAAVQSTNMSFPYTQRAGAQDYQAFTHLGFRYLEIPGAGEEITADDVTATIVHTAVPEDGEATFDSSDETLDAVFELMRRSALYSVQETFVDTPTREKGQFLADTANISYALTATSGDRVASRQAIREFLASQKRYWNSGNDAGRYNAVYPNGDGKRDIPDFTELFPNWVWRYYLETGDKDLLKDAYPAIIATADYVRRHIAPSGVTQGLVTRLSGGSGQYQYGIVDWPAPGRFGYDMTTTARTTVNALGVDVFRNAAAIAAELGRPDDEVQGLTGDADALAARMNATLRRADGVYVDGILSTGEQSAHAGQHATSYAIAFGIAPEADRPALADHLASLGMKQGPMTAHWLLDALATGGADDAVLRLLTNAEDLGWARHLARGHTFTPEDWTAESTGNSLSHGWGAQSIVDIVESALGIEITAPGAAELRIRVPGTRLAHAKGTISTQRGRVASEWTRDGDALTLRAEVPVNVSAIVELPVSDGFEYRVTGTAGAVPEELGVSDGLARYRVGSGAWSFEKARDTTPPTATATTTPAAPDGADGWHTSGVTVTVTATDFSGIEKIETNVNGGGWTPYTDPVSLPDDGSHTVAYRATDKAGNVGTEKAATVRIDGTKPTVLISGVADGVTYGDSQDVQFSWEAVDGTSGVKTLTGRLDGEPYQPGLLPLYGLDLGTHEVEVTATDNAGNETVTSVTFGVGTSSADLAALVGRFAAAGRLSQKAADKLQDRIGKLRDAEADSRTSKIRKALNRVREESTDAKLVPDAEVRTLLTRDVDALLSRLSD